MGLSRRQFTKEFKLTAIRRLEQGVSLGEVARALEVNPNVLHRWRRELRQGPGNAFPGFGKRRWDDTQQAKLERKIGQLTMENDFLKKALTHFRDHHPPAVVNGGDACLKKSSKPRRKAKP